MMVFKQSQFKGNAQSAWNLTPINLLANLSKTKNLQTADSVYLNWHNCHWASYQHLLQFVTAMSALDWWIKVVIKCSNVGTFAAVSKMKLNACLALIQNVSRKMNNLQREGKGKTTFVLTIWLPSFKISITAHIAIARSCNKDLVYRLVVVTFSMSLASSNKSKIDGNPLIE